MQTDAPAAVRAPAAGLNACPDLVGSLELSDGRSEDRLATVDHALAFRVRGVGAADRAPTG
jgi:hypothetical protein